jgi:uncharacterized membrane protein
MQFGEFGWTLARWNLVVALAIAILTFAVGGFDPTVALLG